MFFPVLAAWLMMAIVFGQEHQGITLERRSTGKGYSLCGSCSLPAAISSHAQLAAKDESGEPIVLSGTVYRKDGVTPDSGITMFFYQTDSGGYYHRPEEDVFHPRIYGWIRTGRDGHYEIRTVRPGPEVQAPNEPAHIHVHIFGKGMPEHFLHEFWFEGDNHISAGDRKRFSSLGTFSPIVSLKRGEDGIARGVRDIRVRPAAPWRYEEE